MKLAIIGAAFAAFPMTCTAPPPQQHRDPPPVTYAPAVRIPYPGRCAELHTGDVEIEPDGGVDVVIWYLLGTDIVFGYSRGEKANIYPTMDCLERSP